MATGIYNRAPKSPGRGHTISQLRQLRESGYHNPDTGTELQPEEADAHLHHLEQRKADKVTASKLNAALRMQGRSRGRAMIPAGKVVFRNIHGHVVPFRKETEVWL